MKLDKNLEELIKKTEVEIQVLTNQLLEFLNKSNNSSVVVIYALCHILAIMIVEDPELDVQLVKDVIKNAIPQLKKYKEENEQVES